MLVIADGQRAVALAGVMGGANSEVTAATTDILLESAYFDGPCIRRTAKLLGLQSESSARFERGVRGAALEAGMRAAQLICDHAGATALRGGVDVNYTKPRAAFPCRFSRCVSLLGLQVPVRDARNVLDALGFSVAVDARDEDMWQVTPPAYRVDCAEAPDVAEDIARVLGYDTVPTDNAVTLHAAAVPAPIMRWREQVRAVLVGAGLHEAMAPSLIAPDLLTAAGIPADAPALRTVALRNAMTQEQSVLRTLLYPGLIRAVQRNSAFGAPAARLFELGRVYRPAAGGNGFEEEERLSIILWGAAAEKGVWDAARELDFTDGVGVLDGLLAALGVDAMRTATQRPGFHPGRTAALALTGGTAIGFIGELEPRLLRALDLRGRVVIAELLAAPLCAAANPPRTFAHLPRFPLAERDIAFVVPDDVTHQRVRDVMSRAGVAFVTAITVFDVYRGEHVPAGHKSMAYRIGYRLSDRTLTDAEIDAAHQTIAAALTAQLGAQVRG
jgi:phenylalanyl-tRNA synthetase beta chain